MIVNPVKVVVSSVEFCVLVTPADCGHDAGRRLALHAVPRRRAGLRRPNALRKHARGGKGIVAGDGVVDDGHVQRVLQRYSRAIPTRHVVDDDVVGDGSDCSRVPDCPLGKRGNSVPLTCCRRMPPPLPLSAMLAWIRLALITRSRTRAVAQSRRAIRVNLSPANRIGIGRAHHLNSATVGGNGGVVALVENDRVVLDVAVVDESEVSDTSAFTPS